MDDKRIAEVQIKPTDRGLKALHARHPNYCRARLDNPPDDLTLERCEPEDEGSTDLFCWMTIEAQGLEVTFEVPHKAEIYAKVTIEALLSDMLKEHEGQQETGDGVDPLVSVAALLRQYADAVDEQVAANKAAMSTADRKPA